MSFLYPSLLWALSLLAIPVIIHFFHFRKLKVVEFPTLQFLKEIKEETQRKRTLKHLLILLARLLFLAFLIAAFAQPYIQNDQRPSGRRIIYLDNSHSMGNEVINGKTSLEEAIEIAETMIARAPVDRQFQLLTNDVSRPYSTWDYWAQSLEKLTEVNYSDRFRSFENIVSQATRDAGPIDLLVMSDFQKSTFGPFPATLPDQLRMTLLPIISHESINLHVDTAYFNSPVFYSEKTNDLIVEVKNAGTTASRDIQVKLTNDSRLVASTSTQIGGGQTQSLTFSIDPRNLLSNRLKIELSDLPVTFDNAYYLLIPDYRKPRITHIMGKKAVNYFSALYANTSLFDYQEFDQQSIDYPRLDESDLIILNELTSLPSYLGSMAPTDILILPAEDVEPDAYSTLTGGSLTYRKDTVFSALQMPDLNDPLFQDVFVKKNSTPALPKVKIKFSPPSYDVALLKTDFGTPVLTTRYRRGATIYFLGCPLNENYTQLPTHSLFVPLFYRIAQTSAAINRPLAYRTDQRVLELETTTQPGREQLTITGSNESFIPNVHFSGSRMTLELPPSNLLPGFYSLTSTTDTLQEFALNYAKQESQLDTYSQSELTELAGRHEHVSIVDYANTLQFQDPLYSDLSGESLWKYALILALMFLFAEILLARFL